MKTSVEILMVEDNRGDVVLIQEAIQRAGLPYNLAVATDGVEALEYLRRKGARSCAPKPELLILDLKLPKKTGMEVMEEIHFDSGFSRIPIVILSSSASELSIARSRWEPPYRCVSKPTTFDGYIELVRTIEAIRTTYRKADTP